MSRAHYEYVIVGAGMAGLSAAYHLAEFSDSVLVLDAREVGNAAGSSSGTSRMYREMYSDPYFCKLSRLSNLRWRALESRHEVQLLRQHGLLFYGEPFEEETIEGCIPGAQRVMDEEGIPYEALDAQAISGRFPLKAKPEDVGLFEPTAGAILSDKVLTLFRASLLDAGIEIREFSPVRAVVPERDSVRIVTESAVITANQVLLAAGPWTNELMLTMLGKPLPLEVWGMLWAHYEVPDDIDYPQWFYFRKEDPTIGDGGLYYGFPAMDQGLGGKRQIKVGLDWTCASQRVDRVKDLYPESTPLLVGHLDRFVREHVAGLGDCLELRTSPYTMTPDTRFVLDRIHERVVCFTGGSGQAFKFCPIIGELLGQLLRNEEPIFDISPLSVARFATAS